MIYIDLSSLENHLWQSSLCVAGVWLLTFVLKQNRATLRYRLWLAASAKFLVPFSLLVKIGGHLGWRSAPASGQPQWTFVVEDIGHSFAMPATVHQAGAIPSSNLISTMLFLVWISGVAVSILLLLRSWRQAPELGTRMATGSLYAALFVYSPNRLEPGVFGIRKADLAPA
ncbi:MAG TPA: hypothetical protein VHZ07_19410 [Bryobacteraceae bacterium]|jgi:hypothetical protein|nr:hypothetical protein [Bryobacteraceae bacterium]